MRRILITGSRTWPKPEIVWAMLDGEVQMQLWGHPPNQPGLIVVHGGAVGADKMARDWTRAVPRHRGIRVQEEQHLAQWRPYGIYNPQAGLARNLEMVKAGADIVYAFIHNGSRGATHCAEAAEKVGIETVRISI